MNPTLLSASREDLRVAASEGESPLGQSSAHGAEQEAAPETRREFAVGARQVAEITHAVEALRASGVVVERAPMPSIPPAPAPPDDAPTVRDLTEPE